MFTEDDLLLPLLEIIVGDALEIVDVIESPVVFPQSHRLARVLISLGEKSGTAETN